MPNAPTAIPQPLPSRAPEILAPAGGRAQFFAALNAGADAVYLGLKEFNARARAANFTVEELAELVPLARRYGMKVLVTVNILIKETELSRLVEVLSALEALEVHAIIVQDLAVARMARRYFPTLRLHASTQMAVHNLAGVKQAWRYGFRRVVLARELTAKEVSAIRAAVPDDTLELEAFCHGSLCYSYSGLCFFSGAADARSGNRGECAYTCRQPYKILNEPGHGFLFSMRDLDTSQDLATLVGTGVHTLKIEGRKKDAQYVSTVVKLYRRRLDEIYGTPTLRPEAPPSARELPREAELRHDLALTFQRQATSFFLKGRYYENVIDLDNPTHLGLRVGEIRKVLPGKVQVWTETELERFDGLKLMTSERVFHAKPQHGEKVSSTVDGALKRFGNEAAQFSLQDLFIDGKRVFECRPGRLVEIGWPQDAEPARKGDVLYKVRSADLKRRLQKLESPPPDERLRALAPVSVHVDIAEAGEKLRLTAAVSKLGEPVTEASIEVERQAARGAARLERDLTELLSLFGDSGIEAGEITVSGATTGWFVPRSHLKELKHLLEAKLAPRYAKVVSERQKRALEAVAERIESRPDIDEKLRIHVKTDRLEVFEALQAVLSSDPSFPLGDLVLEPKRAFLPTADAASLVDKLQQVSEATRRPVRLALPTVIRAWDEPLLKKWLLEAAKRGMRRYEAGNVGALELLDEWGLLDSADVSSDFTLYALSGEASRFWAEHGVRTVTLSIEDDLTNLAAHLARWPWETGARPQAILYKDTPLFIAEACSLTALHNGCPTGKVCGYRTLEIENPAGEKFFVAHETCKSIVYAEEAYSVTHRREALLELGVRDFRIDFLTRQYSKERVIELMRAAGEGQKISGTHTANFDRSLL